MADSNEPKKETVRITVSPQPSSPPPAPAESQDTVRIHLPTRPPTNPPPAPADSPSPTRGAADAMPAPRTTPAPLKEMGGGSARPVPPAKPAGRWKRRDPLFDWRCAKRPSA